MNYDGSITKIMKAKWEKNLPSNDTSNVTPKPGPYVQHISHKSFT